MKLSRQITIGTLVLAVLLVAGVMLINLRAAPQSTEVPAASQAADALGPVTPTSTTATATGKDPFAIPEGTVADQLKFLDRLTRPTQRFTSMAQANAYWEKASAAMSETADRILKEKITGEQASEAVQFKAEALRMQAMLGDETADARRTQFLNESLKDPRFEVASVVGPLRIIPKMRRWVDLDAEQKNQVVNDYIADVKAAGPTPGQAQLLMSLADSLSDSPDRGFALRAVDQLLPVLQKSEKPEIKDALPMLEGISRRLRLPGNQLELAGTFIDGKPLDWDSYRGKVVLVDFWSTSCPGCIQEIPNIQQNLRDYGDKGFEVIGVALENDRARTEKFMKQVGMDWPQLFEDKPSASGWAHPLGEKYAVMAIPRAILVDKDGKVVTMMALGPELRANLEKLLGPPSVATKDARYQ